ncbi:MAG: hypothetical protein KCHDKBKB_01222 [Elusimicrobia bacterium]|nr:hypothetical protein [Elusimicrobiota bacterium]
MDNKKFFTNIDFNKSWDVEDWEKFFQAQDDYRVSCQNQEIRKKPMAKIKFVGPDEVKAFEPLIHEYGVTTAPSIVGQIHGEPFVGDQCPEADYHPATNEDPHYWGEGAPLSTVLIYRDCCRFAICTSQEIDRYLKFKDLAYRKKHGAEFESLRFHANWIAINIAQGHTIGYSEERVRGNIAKVIRALKHADICMGLLSRVSLRTKSVRLREDLFSFAVQLRNGLFHWCDELKARLP